VAGDDAVLVVACPGNAIVDEIIVPDEIGLVERMVLKGCGIQYLPFPYEQGFTLSQWALGCSFIAGRERKYSGLRYGHFIVHDSKDSHFGSH